jgi:hypothetical protein
VAEGLIPLSSLFDWLWQRVELLVRQLLGQRKKARRLSEITCYCLLKIGRLLRIVLRKTGLVIQVAQRDVERKVASELGTSAVRWVSPELGQYVVEENGAIANVRLYVG